MRNGDSPPPLRCISTHACSARDAGPPRGRSSSPLFEPSPEQPGSGAERAHRDERERNGVFDDFSDRQISQEHTIHDDQKIAQRVEQRDGLQPCRHVLDWRSEAGKQHGRHQEKKRPEDRLLLSHRHRGDEQADSDDGGEIENSAAVKKKQRTSQRHVEEEDGNQNVDRDVEQSDKHRRRQFAEQDLAGAERGHHQLVQRAKLALAGDREGGDDKSDEQRDAGNEIRDHEPLVN